MRPVLRATPEALGVLDFLLRPPVPAWLVPPRYAWTCVSDVAYSALPGWARELYGRPGLPERTTTRRLRTLRRMAFAIPDTLRWRVPYPHLPEAIARLGKPTTPSARRLRAAA
jgi:hypothetical protein